MISFKIDGTFDKTKKYLNRIKKPFDVNILNKYGEEGLEALRNATPKNSGITSESWSYEIVQSSEGIKIIWNNSNVVNGWYNVAVFIQYGHGTGTGGYVEGIDYINPTLRPIFNKIIDEVWREVIRK